MAVTAATYRLPAVTAAHLSSGSGRRIFNTGIANKLYEVCTAGFLSFTNYSLFFFLLVVFQLQKCLRQERENKLTPPPHSPNSQSAPAVGC